MLQLKSGFGVALVAATALVGSVSLAHAGSCVVKAAQGTGSDEKAAKFQVDEALLQAVDWGAWAAWMANGTTPGYKYGKRKYKCSKGGLGVVCRGQAKICKL
ncbi:MAG TPA: hypothetical protein P5114_10980 [Hyphomicrobiaceae bacterium]|nr:hypothetical protein [Hyphomicrobiaceae bacterium]